MKPYLLELNEVQRNAVTTTEGPILVIAGPGSGKTRVLTYRISHLIQEGVAPYEILSLTFTNKSAKEMKERITKVVGERGQRVWAGTFHSIFARILRNEAEKIGYPSNFTIYDSDDSESVVKAIIKEMNLDKDVYHAGSIRSRISLAKNNLISPKAYEQNVELLAQDKLAKRPYFYKIYEEYTKRCHRSGAMDFDDLLYQFFILLHRNPDSVLEKYQKRFRYYLVDEFQDTNSLQYAILKKLTLFDGSPRNLCVVGDDAQSIYAFRGATIDNILDFEKDFKDLKTFKLEQNYRSTHFIVRAANDIIAYNRKQIKKEIWTDKNITDSSKIKVIRAITDNEEGKRIVDLIAEQKNRYHLDNKDIAILYRTNSQSRIFEEYLRRMNIPYRVYGGMSFYQRKEVKDLVAYLRLVINPFDEEALRRVLNYPRRGIGDSTVEKISELASSSNRTMWECLTEVQASAQAKRGISDFMDLIQLAQKRAKNGSAYEVASFIAKQSKLIDTLKADTTEEGMGRLDNIISLLDGIKDFVENDVLANTLNQFEGEEDTLANDDRSLATYLQNIALLTDADEKDPNVDAVVLMSVHSSKGLEFKSVFVVGMEENLFPSFMSLESPEGIDEERRLFYVAVTRAERFLTLSYATSRYRHGQVRNNPISRFLDEIDVQNMESIIPKSSVSMSGSSVIEDQRAKLVGNFKPIRPIQPAISIAPSDFKPSSNDLIQAGQRVLHLKFGEGKVMAVDGANDNRVATIDFQQADEPRKRIMLKFAKLQILE
jgi:DNA helicase II / ATP-dependent DNA helicase PcrA